MIELAVSIAIASIVVIGLYGLFTMQSQQLMTQDMRMEMHQNARFGMEILSRSIRMAGFGSNGTILGVLGTGGQNSSQLPAVISYDANNSSSGSDAITVVYMEPSLVMNSTYSSIERCNTQTITFNPNHLDYRDRLMQLKAGYLLMCQDYAAIGAMETYLWSISQDADVSNPFGVINVNSASGFSDFANACPSNENLSPIMRCSKGQVMTFTSTIRQWYRSWNTSTSSSYDGSQHELSKQRRYPLVDNVEDLQLEYCVDGGNLANCRPETV